MIESATFTMVRCRWWMERMSHTAERSLSWMYSFALRQEPPRLDEEALAQVARRAADRVEALDDVDHLLRASPRHARLQGQRDERVGLAARRPRGRGRLRRRLERLLRRVRRVLVG